MTGHCQKQTGFRKSKATLKVITRGEYFSVS